VKKVSDVNVFASYGVFITPALVIDGEVKSAGMVPSLEEIKQWLK